MRRSIALVPVLLALASSAGCGGGSETTPTTTAQRTLGPPKINALFGHISSLKRKGQRYELRFDPAWFTSGVTANAAAAEDGAVEPGQPVPNDNYVVEEGHRLLQYLVPPGAHVTVLTTQGNPANFGATPISVAELARIVNGGKHHPLFEPLESGVWLRLRGDTVLSVDQQYRP